MKYKSSIILLVLLLLTSCRSTKIDCSPISVTHFRTASQNGLYYFMDDESISCPKGELAVKNLSPYTVLLTIYNKSEGDKIQYVALLESGEVVHYVSLDPEEEYLIGARVNSDKGSEDVDFLICTDYDNLPEDFFDKENFGDKIEHSLFDRIVDKLEIFWVL